MEQIPGFKIFRRDRNRRGGGVMVYVSQEVNAKRREDLEDDAVEAIWMEIKVN